MASGTAAATPTHVPITHVIEGESPCSLTRKMIGTMRIRDAAHRRTVVLFLLKESRVQLSAMRAVSLHPLAHPFACML